MPKSFLRNMGIMALLIFITGCQTSGVNVRAYVEDKPRIDQDLTGNAGYLMGKPKNIHVPRKTTRRVYVVELAAKDKIPVGISKEERQYQTDIPQDLMTQHRKRIIKKVIVNDSPDIQIPSFDDIDAEPPVKQYTPPKPFISSSVVEYVVEKNDTLQKISKKFYGSYSKWMRIYEANKEVIDNPDRIKPGITLQIPVQ